ncbi:hypothetical protein [Methanobacterium formicicum]|uniref:Uncharacterized protein n=1 Tax=Methanobacterium formicicum TaxID=2162 RepID=A0A843AHD3_METFO|nr:hypothetical protein [Methanobacterium formicicum]MBF4474557.1 hypothetical protein [Methanobacterium formicicum]
MKVIRFAEDFPKLKDDFFTTIRSYDKNLNCGAKYTVKTPTKEFEAFLVDESYEKLMDVPTDLLCHDTNTSSRDDALEKLREFYPYIRVTDDVKIFYFTRLKSPYPYPGWFWCDSCGIPFRPGIGDKMYMGFAGHKPKGKCRFCIAEEEEK